ncbi:hypothetical protein [Formosa maritima]|uniref:Uncharacterized protein n=1 Tax=Formosa maritima TaxID=2592046 RepID=A0A5D0G993_9FLAO|nr:hypothetical protein [Formosa maritima]TYA55693.1 hypothetical protein FVF61_07195 [Formosa maritima]
MDYILVLKYVGSFIGILLILVAVYHLLSDKGAYHERKLNIIETIIFIVIAIILVIILYIYGFGIIVFLTCLALLYLTS